MITQFNSMLLSITNQGWGPRGLASTSRTARGQNFVALASKISGLGLDDARP